MQVLKVAVLDLNKGHANQGMRCIQEILQSYAQKHSMEPQISVFDVRGNQQVPDYRDFNIYISTGGPGSPWDGLGTEWEDSYFKLIDDIDRHNKSSSFEKKYIFFVCHSFQLACRYFNIGEVVLRKSQSFGVLPVHLTRDGFNEPIFQGLNDPFFAVDSRDWQVIQPNKDVVDGIGTKVLALEKIRPHVPLERCIMAIRFNNEMIGTQFHPEADSEGMYKYMLTDEKKELITKNHSLEKYENMLEHLNDPDKITLTQSIILPSFLDIAVGISILTYD
jgi:homoserine O-succinyltransferase/O-acetyltransferase